MVTKVEITELSQSVDALIEKYGKLSGSASAAAKAKLLAKAAELRESLDKAKKELPPAAQRGVEATRAAASTAREAFVTDVVPLAITALGAALDAIAETSERAKTALADSAPVVPAVPEPKKKRRGWLGFVAAPLVIGAVAAVAYAVFAPQDESWIPVEDEFSEGNSVN